MRKTSLVSGILLLLACNNGQTSASVEAKPPASESEPTYAYTPKDKPNWEMGDPKNIAFVLNGLKKYETNRIDELSADFADSVWFAGDGFQFEGPKDSLLKIFKKEWENTKSIAIEMHDWEAVHGKTNNEDWVSLWYKETVTDKNGKVDSVMHMDDIRIVNGKITIIDSKQRRWPEKK